jgi:hypothetical protein
MELSLSVSEPNELGGLGGRMGFFISLKTLSVSALLIMYFFNDDLYQQKLILNLFYQT